MQLLIFIGLQGAGKSSFYHTFFADSHLRLNGDMLKTANREKILFEACLNSKTKTVIDKTNSTKDDRLSYITLAKQAHFTVIAYYFDVDFDDAMIRNNARTGKAKIPEVGVKSVAKKLQKPTFDEGFDKIFYVSVNHDKNLAKNFTITEQFKETLCDLKN